MAVHRRLAECYGRPEPMPQRPLLDVLVQTILSQNTTDRNSLEAYRRLRQRYPSWTTAARAGARSVARAIRQGGLAQVKSRRIVKILRRLIAEQGRPSLEHLLALDPETAYAALKEMEGVGPKTAACTLLFGAGIPIFPVDTHIFRVSQRLDWAGPRESRENFQERIRRMVPPEIVYPLHLNMIAHGRTRCRPAKPRCRDCCLYSLCGYRKEK